MSKEARAIFNVLFIGAAVGTGLYLSRGPWQMYRQQKSKADQAQGQMRAAEKEREQLTKENAHSDTPAGREEAARKAGFLKPGEQKVETAP